MVHISVIIPTYRPGAYIYECLRSLELQDYREFEVIIILNGDKEPYFTELNRYAETSNLNCTICWTAQKGVSNARNEGLLRSTGDAICFVDDDDRVSPTYLKGLYETWSEKPDEIVVCDVRTFTDHDATEGEDYIGRAYQRAAMRHSASIFKNRSFLSTSCCKLIPRVMISDSRFDPSLSIGEDSLFMYSLSSRIKHIALAPSATIYYRRLRESSASRKKRPLKDVVSNKMVLMLKYSNIYFRNIWRSNPCLFLSRIIALFR